MVAQSAKNRQIWSHCLSLKNTLGLDIRFEMKENENERKKEERMFCDW